MAFKPVAMHLHALPEGSSSISRLQLTAARMGYSSIVVGNHHDSPEPEGARLPITEIYGSVEIRIDSASKLSRIIPTLRNEYDILAVHGDNASVFRTAIENSRVDVVCHTHRVHNGVNHVLARLASRHNVAMEFSYGPIIRLRGSERERMLRDQASILALQRKYEFPYVVAGGAWSHYDIRAPRDVEALCATFGMEPEEVRLGLDHYPRAILKRSRDENRLGEGVYLCE